MDDISDAMSVATSTPEDAAANIGHGNLFSIDPRYAAQNKTIFDQKASQLLAPQTAEPPIADYSKQSSEHAALAKPDIDHLNFMARQANLIGDYVFNKPNVQQKIVDLNLKKMNQGGQLSGDDENALIAANLDSQDLEKKDYGISGPIEKIPAIVAGGISDIGQSMVRGARKGLLEGPFKSILGNLAYGTSVKEPFDNLTAGTYNELGNLTDDNGNPVNLDHDTKANISRGVGVVGTALMNVGGLAIAETTPFLKPFMNPVLAKGLINTPAKAAVLTSIGNLMKGSAAVGGVSGLTEFTKIVGEEIAKAHGTDEAGFWNALGTAVNRVKENQGGAAERVGQATGQGALFGAALELPLQIAGFGATKHNFEQGFKNYVETLPPERDVTPQPQAQITGEAPTAPHSVIDITPPEIPPGHDPVEGAFKSLQLNEALHQINDVQKSTGMNDVAPTELEDVNKRSFEAGGFKKFYSSFQTLRDWANSEEKGKAARSLIDPSGVAAGQMNASIELDPHKVMKIAKDYPDILDHISYDPNAPTGMQAKEYVEALNRAEEKRAEVMQKLGIKPEEIKSPSGASVTALPEQAKAPASNYDFEASTREAARIIAENKNLTEHIQQAKDAQNFEDLWDKEKGVTSIDGKTEKMSREKFIKMKQDMIDSNTKDLEKLKTEIIDQLKESPPGKLLMYPFDEAKTAVQAEMKFGREPTFSDALRSVLPEQRVAEFDKAVLGARQHVTNLVHDQAVHEMNKVVDQTAEIAKEDRLREELSRIANDPNYALVDKFRQHQIANAKGKAKRSLYAIDPATLPDDLIKYVDNPRLKDHKVFAKGANSAEDSAKALGFASAKDLLEVLAKTPTRDQMIKARTAFYDSDIEKLARDNTDLDHTSIMKAFTDKTKAYLETMRFLKDNDWSKTKFGIKKIALPLPRIEDIENDAREAVKKLTVGELKPSKFVVGERQSYKNAVDKFLAGDLAGAFQEKEMAARNSAMQKEVRKQIGAVNRAQKFARKLEDPAAKQIFKTAGKFYENARDEILDVFNFNPSKKNQAEQNSYAKWVKRELEQGRGDFSIPPRLSDVRESIDQMTVEQVVTAEDRLRAIFSEAKFKAELIDNKEMRDEERSVDRIAEQTIQAAELHPGSNDANFKDVQGNETPFSALRHFVQDAQVAFTNMEHILRYYDKGNFNGFFHETFMRQIKGDGKFNLKMGVSKELNMSKWFADTAREIMKNHGDYENVEKTRLTIPEFKDYPSLSNGELTKGDLMTLWAYKGDPDGRAKLQSNHRDSLGRGIQLETWQKVFDRELTRADVTSMQYGVDMYKKYQAETSDIEQRTKGRVINFIKGVPNKWKDEYFPGGYVPNKHKHEWSAEAAKHAVQMLEGKRAAWFEKDDGADFGRQFAAEQTEQGRLVNREGSNKPLDASLLRFWRGHEEVIHDLSYREPTMNALKLLRDKRIREAMIKMGGEARYNLLVNSVIEVAGRAEMMNANFFADQNRFFKGMTGYLQNRFNIIALGINTTSAAVQYEELTQLLQNIGVSGQKHFAMVNAKMMATPHLWGGYYEWAAKLDPTIGAFKANIQNKITSTVHDIIPTKTSVPFGGPLKRAGKWSTDRFFAAMSVADVHDKIICAMTCYSQFISGDANNWPLEKVMALTPEQRDQEAQAYVRQMSRLSLMHGRPEDKAPSQKHPLMEYFSTYWNFFRNVLNNQVNHGNRAKWAVQAGGKALGEGGGSYEVGGRGFNADSRGGNDGGDNGGGGPFGGKGGYEKEGGQKGPDFKGAAGHFGDAAAIVALTAITASIGRWYTAKLRGEETPDQWDIDWKSAKGIEDAGRRMGKFMMMSPVEQIANAQPIVRNVLYAANAPDKTIRGYVDRTKTVEIPIVKQLSDAATALNLIREGAQGADNLSDFLTYLTNLDNKETKVLMSAEADFLVPFPVNAYSKLMRYLELPLNSPAQIGPAALDKLNGVIHKFTAKQEQLTASNEPGQFHIDPKFIDEVKDVQKQIQPEVATIPPGITDKIKGAMSGGDWTKPNGIYGFSKDQWAEVKAAAPDLGLTDAGRIAKNTEQQEKAMDFLLHFNSQKLAEKDIRVNNESLYGAFRLGADEYEKLYKAPRDAKLKSVLSEETLKENPDLGEAKTVGQAKLKLMEQLSKGQPKKTAQLTPPTSNAED